MIVLSKLTIKVKSLVVYYMVELNSHNKVMLRKDRNVNFNYHKTSGQDGRWEFGTKNRPSQVHED